MSKLEKTKEKGISAYVKDGQTYYSVNTTFSTKDKKPYKLSKRGFRTLREAVKWKTQTAVDIKNKTMIEINSKKTNFYFYIEDYVKYKSVRNKPSTIYQIRKLLNAKMSFFGNKAIEDITVSDITSFYAYLESNFQKASSFNYALIIINGFFEWCELMNYMEREMYHKFKLVMQPKKTTKGEKIDFFEINEIQLILNAMPIETIEQKMEKLLITILFFTGLRKCEAMALQYKDFDIEKGKITIDKQATRAVYTQGRTKKEKLIIANYTKTDVNKLIDVPSWLIDMVMIYKQETNEKLEDYLFLEKITLSNLRNCFNNACERVGLEPKKIHSTRHSYTTMIMDLGVTPDYAAKQLGHTSQNVTLNTYTHITEQRRKNNNNIINSLVNPSEKS